MALKKQWYDIIAPKMFGEKVVGETLSVDPKYVLGRTVDVTLMDISKDYSKFYMKLNFQVERIEGQKAFTKFIGHDTMRERIFRMVQRRSRKIEAIIDTTTKDGVNIRLKSVFVLIRRVGTSVKNQTRAKAKEVLEKTANESTLEDLIKLILSGELAAQIRKECKKISPVGDSEIRQSQILKEKKILESVIA
jgi:small subunit ribosomal protein S3Ae